MNELFYNKKHNIELNNKAKIQKANILKSNLNNINLIYNTTTEIPYNNNNSIKNLSLKSKLGKLLTLKDKSYRNEKNKNKNKYYKKLSFNKTKTLYNTEISIDNNKENEITLENKNNNNKDNKNVVNSYKNLNKDILKDNIKYSATPIKSSKINENIENRNIKKYSSLITDKEIVNTMANKTVNELDYKKLENNCLNLKNKKGTFSFNAFLKKHEKEKDNELQNERNYFSNRFKDKIKNKTIIKKENLKIEQNEDIINNTVKDIKNRNNIILLNFRSDKRKGFIKEDRISTSSEKETSAKNGASKILELLRNKKSQKIILKQNEEAKKKRCNKEINNKKEGNEIEIKACDNNIIEDNKNNIENKILKAKKGIYDNYNENNENKEIKDKQKNNNTIFKRIIDEVKQEKNIIQKIVHRKLIQGVKELKKYRSCNKLIDSNSSNRRYNTETFTDMSMKYFHNQNSVLFEDNVLNINIGPNIISNRKEEKNNRYLNINLEGFKNINKNYEKFKTYKSEKVNSYSYDKIESGGVKIKKIKLDKLRNKIQKNKLQKNYYNGDNININLNLNNKIININNSQKIYMPKRISITKKPSIEMMSIPISYSHSPDYNYKINYKTNTLTPYIYSKKEHINKSAYMNNNIDPYNDINIFDLNNNNKNKNKNNVIQNPELCNKLNKTINNIFISDNNNRFNSNTLNNINNIGNENKNIKDININTNNSYNKKSGDVKHILYNKVKIKTSSENSFSKIHNINENQYLTTNRCKTIRYIKKSKNKIERINTNNKNKIIKIQEMQIGGMVSKKYSDTTLANFTNMDKTQPINFNLKSPSNKQNSFINYRTFLSSDMNEMAHTGLKEYNKNEVNFSEEKDDTLSTKRFNTGTTKVGLGCNFSYDKIMNNITGTDDIINENNDIKFEQILNLLSFEDLLIIEDKFNLILIVLEKGNKTYEEYFDLWVYFFSSGLKSKLEQIFKYFIKEAEDIRNFINYSLIFIIICYDFVVNSISIDIDHNFSLIEIGQVIYTNILFVINLIKSRISFDHKDNYNIRLIELSKIEMTIKNRLSNIDNDYLFIKEILHSNTNLIIKKITSVIENNLISNISNKIYSSEIFSKIKASSFGEINSFFLDKILKEEFIGCSVLASTYLKEKQHFTPAIVPYIRVPNKKKYTLVLDLDETLIHFKVNEKENEEGVLKLRPGVFTFLKKIREFYEIVLFTEASEAYTKLMMEAFNNSKENKKYFDYKFYRQHTIIIGSDFIKDLSRIGRPLDKTIIIDNIAQNFKMQKSNGILIKPFLGEDHNDQALIDLIPILTNIARDEIDVRNGLMKYRDEILTKISSNLFRRNKHN